MLFSSFHNFSVPLLFLMSMSLLSWQAAQVKQKVVAAQSLHMDPSMLYLVLYTLLIGMPKPHKQHSFMSLAMEQPIHGRQKRPQQHTPTSSQQLIKPEWNSWGWNADGWDVTSMICFFFFFCVRYSSVDWNMNKMRIIWGLKGHVFRPTLRNRDKGQLLPFCHNN